MGELKQSKDLRELRQRVRPLVAGIIVSADSEADFVAGERPGVLGVDGQLIFSAKGGAQDSGRKTCSLEWRFALGTPTASGEWLSLVGTAQRLDVDLDPAEHRKRFEALIPGGLADGSTLWILEPERVSHVVPAGGSESREEFASVDWLLPAAAWRADEAFIIDHMNGDHGTQMTAICRHFFHIEPEQVQLVGLDSEGFYIRGDDRWVYVPFARTCETTGEITLETIRLSMEAGAGPDAQSPGRDSAPGGEVEPTR